MPHTKFCGNWTAGSAEGCLSIFTLYAHGGIVLINFNFLVPKSLHTKNS